VPSRGGVVYFITGGPLDLQDSNITDTEAGLQAFVAQAYPGATFKTVHNSKRDRIYQEIRGRSGDAGPVVLIGHSFGVQASIEIARKLESDHGKIDQLVSLDARQEWGHPAVDVVPDNVARVSNLYETQDIAFQGARSLRRPDGGARGIENTAVPLPSGWWSAHSALVRRAFETHQLQDAVAQGLGAAPAPAALAQLRQASERAQAAAAEPNAERAALGGDRNFSGAPSAAGEAVPVGAQTGTAPPPSLLKASGRGPGPTQPSLSAELGGVPASAHEKEEADGSQPGQSWGKTIVSVAACALIGGLMGMIAGPIGALVGALVGGAVGYGISRLL